MKHNRLKHEVDAPLEIINGWQFYTNEDHFIKTGLGHYEYNFRTREFKFNGKPVELFPIIQVIAKWYEEDQEKHHIDTGKIEAAFLKIDLIKRSDPGTNQLPLLLRPFLTIRRSLLKKTEFEIITEMIIKTDEKVYSKKSGRGFL